MSRLETQRSLESVEEVTEVLERALDEARKHLVGAEKPRKVSYYFAPQMALPVPHASGRGTMIRTFDLAQLEHIAVPGMTADEVIEQALDWLCGPKQAITSDIANRYNAFNVKLSWVHQGRGRMGLPTLCVGKIETMEDALYPLQSEARRIIHNPNFIGSSANEAAHDFLSRDWEYRSNQGRTSALWMGGNTEKAVKENVHTLCFVHPGVKLHLLRGPGAKKLPAGDPSVGEKVKGILPE